MVKKLIILAFVMGLILFPLISSEIIITQPEALYNLGDNLETVISVYSLQEGYLDVDLVCSNNTENLYHGILDSSKGIIINRELTPLYIGSSIGMCYIQANYGKESQKSQSFKISNEVNINLEINELDYKAGETIFVRGTAEKENGEKLEGYVELKLGEEIKSAGLVENGNFEINFSTLENMKAGNQLLTILAYDEDSEGNKLNTGVEQVSLNISQVPSRLEIAIDRQVVKAGENISLIVFSYDKAEETIYEKVNLILKDVNENTVYQSYIKTGENVVIHLKEDMPVGYSKITAESEELKTEKLLEIKENEEVTIKLEGSLLIITNIGNVDYKETLNIGIGEENFTVDVEIKKGEEKMYDLSAPDGEYDISVNSGELGFSGNAILTGRAPEINEVQENFSRLSRYYIVWVFIFLLLGITLIVMYRNRSKKSTYAFPILKSKNPEEKKEPEMKKEKQRIILSNDKPIIKAEHVLVLNGEKNEVGMITIKLKNQLTKDSKEHLSEIIKAVHSEKAVVNVSGEYIFVIVSPLLTRSFDHNLKAVKIANQIDERLKENNRKFKDKVIYSIGVSSGEIINRIDEGKLKFTSIGPTLSMAKRIAEISDKYGGLLLISKNVHEKTLSDVKAEKIKGTEEVFSLVRVVDKEKNREFISEFLQRNK